jgi:hypothetical protein
MKTRYLLMIAAMTVLIASCAVPGSGGAAGSGLFPTVYVGGACSDSGGQYHPGYWKNGTWNQLALAPGCPSGGVKTLAVSGNDVYAGGQCTDTSLHPANGCWKNGLWTGLADSTGFAMFTFLFSGADVYIAGTLWPTATGSVAGYWKNGAWVSLTLLVLGELAGVNSLVMSGSDLYAGGYRYDQAHREFMPGYWKNGTWVALPTLDHNAEVLSIAVAGTDVYCGGYCTSDVEIGAGYWKNGTWTSLPSHSDISQVTSIAVSGADIHAVGWGTIDFTCTRSIGKMESKSHWVTLTLGDLRSRSR